MTNFLRQATAAQSRAIGPFVDETDFKTAKTALTIANTDIKLIVNGAASANKNSGGGTHRVNGLYGVTFDATDTATVGEMEVSVVVAGALPVFKTYFVIEEAVYDAMFAGSALGYVADQPVNVTKVGGTTQTAGDIGANTAPIRTGTAQAGTADSITLDASASATDALYAASWLRITGGTGAGQVRRILTYTGSTKVATVNTGLLGLGWVTTPDNTSTFAILPAASISAVTTLHSMAGGAISSASFGTGAITAAAIAADAITDAKVAADVTIASVGSVTGNVFGSVIGAVGSVTGLTASDVGAIKTKTDFLPSATAGAAGGLFIAGSNAATSVDITGNITGNLSGSVGSVTGSVTGNVGGVTGSVGGNVNGSVGSVTGLTASDVGAIKAKTDNLPSDPADASDIAAAFSTVNGTLATVAGYIDTEVASIKAVTDKLDGMTEQPGSSPTYNRFKATALETLPSGVPAADIADAVWDEVLAGHATAGSTGEALSAAGAAGDPWLTLLPGAYGAGTAGKIVGDNINATISSRATQTSVDTVDDFLDTEIAAIKTKTDFLPSVTAGAAGGLFIAGSNAATTVNITGNVTGNVSGSVGSVTGAVGSIATGGIVAGSFAAGAIDAAAIATDAITSVELAATATAEIATAVRTELTTELGRIDVAISTRASQTSVDTVDDFLDTEIAAIKAKTDNLPAAPAATSDIPTAVENADALLGRTLSGGANGGRMVKDALRSLRNKSSIAGGTLTVCAEDDITTAWTAAVTTTPGDPLSAIDPA